MRKQGPLIHRLTSASREVLDKEIKKAMDEQGITQQEEDLRQKDEEIKRLLEDKDKSDEKKRELEERLAEQKEKHAELEAERKSWWKRKNCHNLTTLCFRKEGHQPQK